MKKKLFISSLTLSALVTMSCSMSPTNVTASDTSKKSETVSNTNSKAVKIDKEIKLTTVDKNGAVNPIVPENLASVEIGGKTIKAKDIKIVTGGFSTKALDNEIVVTYDNGLFKISGDSIDEAAANLIIKFNLLNSKEPVLIPLLKALTEKKITASINSETGETVVGVLKDGKLDTEQPAVLYNQKDNSLVVYKADGTKDNYAVPTDLTKPTPADASKIKEELDKANAQLIAGEKLSAIAPLVGDWLYEGLGQSIVLKISDKGSGSFNAAVNVQGSDYAGVGSYKDSDKATEGFNLASSFSGGSLKILIKQTGNNTSSLTLVDSSSTALNLFKGVPLDLKRKL
jgi:hypothetical protein